MVARGWDARGTFCITLQQWVQEWEAVLLCGYIGRREDDWEILKWFQGIRERLMNEVAEAFDGPFVTKCDYP